MSACLPNCGMHKNGGINPNNVLIELNHRFPPIFPDIILELRTIGTVVINRAESIVNLAGGENKAIFLRMGYQILENLWIHGHGAKINLKNDYIFAIRRMPAASPLLQCL